MNEQAANGEPQPIGEDNGIVRVLNFAGGGFDTVMQLGVTHSLLVNLKFIAPIWRIHPYFALGAGAQYGDFDSSGILDDHRWDPVLRFGFGVDGYITEHWVVNLELAPGIRFKDWGNIPSACVHGRRSRFHMSACSSRQCARKCPTTSSFFAFRGCPRLC